MPGIVNQPDDKERADLLKAYTHTYLEEEIRAEAFSRKIGTGKDIIPIEIKAGARVTLSALRGLSSFIETYKGSVRKAYVVTTGRMSEKLTDMITVLPWQFL